jgi:hypothetical protein
VKRSKNINPEVIHAILADWVVGKKVKIPYHRGMGPKWARAYYHQQHPIRCALIGHKISACPDDDTQYHECFRCGGRFHWGIANRSIFEFFILLPIYRLKKWLFAME